MEQVNQRPMLDLDVASARQLVDPEGVMGEAVGQAVLCLAGGGGQQSRGRDSRGKG